MKIDSERNMNDSILKAIRERYRVIRAEVYQEATRPANGNRAKHQANQLLLRDQVVRLCEGADLDLYRSPTPEARTRLWHHIWSKNRYAGIKARIAQTEIADIEALFDDYPWFSNPCWDLTHHGHRLVAAGQCAQDFLNRTGPFAGKQTIGNLPKLAKIIQVARAYNRFFETHADSIALEFITSGLSEIEIWRIHDRLGRLGYKGDLTILHLMMDLGFPVMKPDIVITRLFLKLGWLKTILPNMPNDLSQEDLRGVGAHGRRYVYTTRGMYRPIIDFSNRLVAGLDAKELEADIGWVTSNPLREFDLFMVKAGQQPDPRFGIERIVFP